MSRRLGVVALCAALAGCGAGLEDDLPFEDEPLAVGADAEVDGVDPLASEWQAIGGGSGPVGGGKGYTRIVSKSSARFVVDTLSELQSALSRAREGDTIYVEDGARINVGRATLKVPRGVTLASGRGRNGSSGALLYTGVLNREAMIVGTAGRVRITGLRVRGPKVGWFNPCGDGIVHDRCGVAWKYDTVGIKLSGGNNEIDNNQVYGWTYAGIATNESPLIHHNSIHSNAMSGLGYGVVGCGGKPLIESNYFNLNRHSIAECGKGGYTARYNVHGPKTLSHAFDMHSPGGTTTLIYNNTFRFTQSVVGKKVAAVGIRGKPSSKAEVHHNWFYFGPDVDGTRRASPPAPVTQTDVGSASSWQNMRVYSNHSGTSRPPSGVGAR